MTRPADLYSLVADVGGTNTRVALADGRAILPDSVRRYANAEFPGLETVLRRYIEDEDGIDPRAACVAVAGPVRDGRATLTNRDWAIDRATLARATGAETAAILNDLQAQGHALGHLGRDSTETVIDGPDLPGETRLVIGVGTGFNAAAVIDTASGRLVPAAEAGHANLPIRTARIELQPVPLLSRPRTAFPAVGTSCSGRGIESGFNGLSRSREAGEPREARRARLLLERLAKSGADPRAYREARRGCSCASWAPASRGPGAGCPSAQWRDLPDRRSVARHFGPLLETYGLCRGVPRRVGSPGTHAGNFRCPPAIGRLTFRRA